MGACATKPGDLKVKGEAPLVVEDAAAPPVAGGERAKADGVPAAAAETDPADVSRRRSLSDLLKQHAETSDGEADQEEAEKKVVTEEPASAIVDAGAPKEPQAPEVQQPSAASEQDTAEELNGDLKIGRELGAGEHGAEEEKRMDPGSVQVVAAAATSADEESKVADDAASA